MKRKLKNKMVAEARRRVVRALGLRDCGHSQCIYEAAMITQVVRESGARCILQAGTMQWPRVTREMDDGAIHTHFSYMWNRNDPISQHYLQGGGPVLLGQPGRTHEWTLPEMHVWAAIPGPDYIIDISTHGLAAAAKFRGGLEWLGPPPPPYLWCKGEELPDWVRYIADKEAIQLAYKLLEMSFGIHPREVSP